jgi:sarcosine oxidase subunit gamma
MSELQISRHGLEPFLASLPNDASGDVGLSIQILPGLGHINLRGNPKHAEFFAAANAALAQELPLLANTVSIGSHQVFWLGPEEWLIITPLEGMGDLQDRLRETLSGQNASVNDLSGGQITLRLSGPRVRDVLAKGCTLDFHPRGFNVGTCAQSGLAKANVLIGMVDDQPMYEIIVRRSFAEYLVLWLRHSAREYGVQFSVL